MRARSMSKVWAAIHAIQPNHSLLCAMPFGPHVQGRLREVQGLIHDAVQAALKRNPKCDALVRLLTSTPTVFEEVPEQGSLLTDLARVGLTLMPSSLRLFECSVLVRIAAGGETVDFSVTGLPSVERLQKRTFEYALHRRGEINEALALRMDTLLATPLDALKLMDADERASAFRLCRLYAYSVLHEPSYRFNPEALRGTFEERLDLIWKRIEHATDRNLASDEQDRTLRSRDWALIRGVFEGCYLPREREELDQTPQSVAEDVPLPVHDGPTHVVIRQSIPAGANAEEKATLERFEVLRKPLPVVSLPSCDVINEIVERLQGEFPWATAAIEHLRADLSVKRRFGAIEFALEPVLLVGHPGTGKSRLVRRIAEELNVDFCPLSLAGQTDARSLLGTARGWASAQPSQLLAMLLNSGKASAFVLLDEVDKAVARDRGISEATVALLNLLEKENAKRWFDTFLQVPCDLSTLCYWATSNSLESVAAPLRSRFKIIYVPEPTPDQVLASVPRIVADLEREWRLPPETLPVPSLKRFSSRVNIRSLRRYVLQALANTIDEGASMYTRH